MATRQHHRVLILGLINYKRSHDLILKNLYIKEDKKLYDPNFISIQLVLSKIFLILLLLTSFLSLISDPGL